MVRALALLLCIAIGAPAWAGELQSVSAKRILLFAARAGRTGFARNYIDALRHGPEYGELQGELCADPDFIAALGRANRGIASLLACGRSAGQGPGRAGWDNPDAVEGAQSDDSRAVLTRFAGRWRFPGSASCRDRFGRISVESGTILFEWYLLSGEINTAIERVDSVLDNTFTTTVMADVGSPNPETGSRIRYVVTGNRWTSENLVTHARAMHDRC